MTTAADVRSSGPGRWFHRPAPRPAARLRLVCVPHAGAGAAAYGTWGDRLPADVELVGVRLPGRENRLREPPFRDWPSLTGAFADALDAQVRSPYVLFGHSMGAMLVYETVVHGTDRRPPERVILSGCRAPAVRRALPAIHGLPDERFREELGRLAGTPREVLADQRLMAVLEPMLRADIRLAETWSHRDPPPVPVPVTTFRGADDEVAPAEAVAAWRTLAPRGIRSHRMPGGHFSLHDHAPEFFRLLTRELSLC
ncbi:thioesterase II family protein [Streptomyces xinghaiensis]|uniref:thioesterase II family protein n=1 Tax=Streptomyces xinghaiensis TaxID=1038928 RepID=UPI002E0EA481|nr:alpha/beta fold hydrolase [Streptomyces xinghaiensis]